MKEGGGNGANGREILDFRFVTLAALATLLLDTAPQLAPHSLHSPGWITLHPTLYHSVPYLECAA